MEQLKIDFNKIVTKLTKPRLQKKNSVLTKEDYDLLEFKRIINTNCPEQLLVTNKQYGNKDLPLAVIYKMLSALYPSYGVTTPFAPQYIEGQIVYTVHLNVFHPILKIIETYSGTSSVPLIPASGDFKWNHRNLPGAEALAVKNATKKIGPLFRNDKEEFSDIMATYFEDKQKKSVDKPTEEKKKRLLAMISAKKTIASLEKISDSVMDLSDRDLIYAYDEKFRDLSNAELTKTK